MHMVMIVSTITKYVLGDIVVMHVECLLKFPGASYEAECKPVLSTLL